MRQTIKNLIVSSQWVLHFWLYRNPNVESPTIKWPRFNERSQLFLTIDVQPGVESYPISEDKLFLWGKCYDLLYKDHMHYRIPSIVRLLNLDNATVAAEAEATALALPQVAPISGRLDNGNRNKPVDPLTFNAFSAFGFFRWFLFI